MKHSLDPSLVKKCQSVAFPLPIRLVIAIQNFSVLFVWCLSACRTVDFWILPRL